MDDDDDADDDDDDDDDKQYSLKSFNVIHFLMLAGKLFYRVAAAFSKHLLPHDTPRVWTVT